MIHFSKKFLLITTLLFILEIFISSSAFAYTLSETFVAGQSTETSVADYFSNLYYFLLGAAAVLAVLKIVMGGLKYVASAGNPSLITDAKEDIQWAVFGLILALSSVLILTTIGGDSLVSFEITTPPLPPPPATAVTTPPPAGTTPPPTAGTGYYDKNPELLTKDLDGSNWTPEEKDKLLAGKDALELLHDADIHLNRNDSGLGVGQNCSSPCTSLNGIPETTINTLVKTKEDCPLCEIIVTGGTEKGHKQQGFGKASIDLKYDENTYKYLKAHEQQQDLEIVREAKIGNAICGTSGWKCYEHVTGLHISVYNKKGGLTKQN
jgi:hypothetical protein